VKSGIIKTFIRIALLGVFFSLFYAVLVVKLWDEQIRQGEEHRVKVSKQSIRCIRIPAIRGRIFSSDMHLLADNMPGYDIVFHPAEMRQPGKQRKTVNHIFASAQRIGAAIGRKIQAPGSWDIFQTVEPFFDSPCEIYSICGFSENNEIIYLKNYMTCDLAALATALIFLLYFL